MLSYSYTGFVKSIIFTIYHIITFDVSSINECIILSIFTLSAGICLGYIYIKTSSLLPCISIHTAYNISQNIISLGLTLLI
ncbi:CPBP family intramembrane glutamic endopeptidase [Paraclostridium ghonii]|uniref:CPBP family intramembrane glutamic endopeptidase n=1 Tax=Paraclostridium ghonii TaxID=29358 RepID=UPI003A5C2F81